MDQPGSFQSPFVGNPAYDTSSTSPTYHPMIVDADNYNLSSGDPGWLSNTGDALTLGTRGAFTSGVNSFINTGVTVANWFGAGLEKSDTYRDLLESNPEAAQYYAAHKAGVDLAGFVAGSLIPGFAGLKALQIAKLGKGFIPERLGLFANRRQGLIDSTLAAIKDNAPGVDSIIRMNKYKAIGYGFADQAIQAAAWETAVEATMGAAPTLDNQDWKDITFNLATGAVIGGAVGGIWDAFGAHGTYKKAQIAFDLTNRQNESLTSYGKSAILPGDRVVSWLKSFNEIPAATTEVATRTQEATYTKAIQKSKIELGKIAPDSDVANELFDALLKRKQSGVVSEDDLYEMLSGAVKIHRVTEADAETPSIFYVKKNPTWDSPLTNAPEDAAGKGQPYKLRNEQIQPSVATVFNHDTATAAFKAGNDIWIDVKGAPHINPSAPNIKQALTPGFTNTAKTEGAPLIVNLRSGAVSDTAVLGIGDLAPTKDIHLGIGGKSLIVGDDEYSHSFSNYQKDQFNEDYLQANSRHIWMAQRGFKPGDVININDISAMDTLARQVQEGTLDAKIAKTLEVQDAEGVKKPLTDFLESQNLQQTLEETKRVGLNSYLDSLDTKLGSNGLPVGKDLRELSARFNLPMEWLEGGMPKTSALDQISPDPLLWARPNSAKIVYSVGDPVKDLDGMIARGMPAMLGRIKRAQDFNNTVWFNYIKEDAGLFPDIDARWSQAQANSLGSGPTALGFNNPDNNTLGEMISSMGAGTHQIKINKSNMIDSALGPAVLRLANGGIKLGGELGAIQNILRGEQQYVLVPGTRYMVLKDLAKTVQKVAAGVDEEGAPITRIGFKKEADVLLPIDFSLKIAGDSAEEILSKGKYAGYKLSDEVYDFLAQHTALNDTRLAHGNNFLAAQGISRRLEQGVLYAPPVDTKKYNFFALVREPSGNGSSSSSVASITAASEADLTTRIAKAREQGYEVYTKQDLKTHHEVIGDYDFNMNLSENVVDSGLKRKGILSDYIPDTDVKDITSEWLDWHKRQETRLLRNMVELKNAQQFAELKDLGENYVNLATSRFGNVSSFTGKTAENPYDDYIKTALDLSKTAEYRLWNDANEKVEAFFDSAFSTAAKMFGRAKLGEISYEEANNASQKFGLGKPFVNAGDYLESQGMIAPKPYLRDFIQGVNSLMSATTLRLDAINSIINVISTPILIAHEVSSMKAYYGTKEGLQRLQELTHTALPDGSGLQIPATIKLLFNANNAFFSDMSEAGRPLLTQMQKTGIDLTILRQYSEMVGGLSTFTGQESSGTLKAMLSKAVNIGEKITGNTLAEQYTRFCTAHTLSQIADALGIENPDVRLAMQRTFVNRVQGNYIASQRPIAFQGVIGQAIGLFQTYQFNLLQQVFRSIENGDKKSLAILFGMQSTLYGLNGLPLFNAINTHIIGNAPGNPTHNDITSAIPQVIGHEAGNFLLYGGASWFTGAALYSRGDINPRNITVLPVNPMDYPAISGITRFAQNALTMGKKLGDGGNLYETLMQGMEHNSLSRPLAGLAQVVSGNVTTGAGDLIARTSETSAIANAARILGAKPLDEGIALDALYRKTAYEAKDTARINQLGQAVKTTLIAGGQPSQDQVNGFATDYAASGGRIDHFNRFFVNAMKNSNQSNVNLFMQKLRDPVAQNMMTIMGGTRLPDYTNTPEQP